MGEAVRTLPDGEAAENRRLGDGSGWFGLVDSVTKRRLDLGEDVTVDVDDDGMVIAVHYQRGPVTDSVLFYVLRSVSFT